MLQILSVLLSPAFIYGAFAVLFLLNVILGVVSNCLLKAEPFEGRRILQSFLKIIVGALSMLGVLLAFWMLEKGLAQGNIQLSQEVENIITGATFLLLFIKGFKNAAIDVYEKTRALFEIKDSTAFDRTAIDKLTIQTTVNKDDVRIPGTVENEY